MNQYFKSLKGSSHGVSELHPKVTPGEGKVKEITGTETDQVQQRNEMDTTEDAYY